jgi:hypothetical protein
MANRKEYQKQYYQKNKDKVLNRTKQYYLNHKKYYTEYKKQWEQDNKEHRDEYLKQWREDNLEHTAKYHKQLYIDNKEYLNEQHREYDKTDAGKIASKRHNHKHRELGFFPLNKYFERSEAHHISENFVIYIPKKIHRSIWHNIWSWQGMEQINQLAINYI